MLFASTIFRGIGLSDENKHAIRSADTLCPRLLSLVDIGLRMRNEQARDDGRPGSIAHKS